jgi:hypothetical protein
VEGIAADLMAKDEVERCSARTRSSRRCTGPTRVLASRVPAGKHRRVDLTERDRAILDFERSWWHETGPKESLIQERFELSTTRYYEILGELLESPEAYEYDPLGVRRLLRLRDRRRRARHEVLQQASEPPGS